MDKVNADKLRELIAHYKGLKRLTLDKGALDALAQRIAGAEDQLQQLAGTHATATSGRTTTSRRSHP